MELIRDICLQVLEISILILGIVGVVLSFLLIISPKLTRTVSNILSQYVGVDKKLTYLNKPIQTDCFTYQHNILAGISLVGGSAFFLVLLFLRLDVDKVLNLYLNQKYFILIEIILKSMLLVGKIAGIAGIVFGLLLLFMPEIMIKIENRMDSWIATQFVADKLDEFHMGIENFIFRYPMLFGFAGLMTSAVLIILSVASLLS